MKKRIILVLALIVCAALLCSCSLVIPDGQYSSNYNGYSMKVDFGSYITLDLGGNTAKLTVDEMDGGTLFLLYDADYVNFVQAYCLPALTPGANQSGQVHYYSSYNNESGVGTYTMTCAGGTYSLKIEGVPCASVTTISGSGKQTKIEYAEAGQSAPLVFSFTDATMQAASSGWVNPVGTFSYSDGTFSGYVSLTMEGDGSCSGTCDGHFLFGTYTQNGTMITVTNDDGTIHQYQLSADGQKLTKLCHTGATLERQ